MVSIYVRFKYREQVAEDRLWMHVRCFQSHALLLVETFPSRALGEQTALL